MTHHDHPARIAIVGAGAAGLMTAITAARGAPGARVVLLDGARTLGAKILVAGGGRCNVTHHAVDERAFAGSTRPAIRRVLRRFDVPATVAFFREIGVTLKREPTGKLFPTTDRARTVLDALLGAARDAGVELRHPWRVERIEPTDDGFVLEGPAGRLDAARVVLATGGCSLPKTGSDGHGFVLARALGHTTTPRIAPALVPLRLADGHPLRGLAGVSTDVTLEVRAGSGRRLVAFDGALLCTHFGISGPAVLDVSRWLGEARASDPAATLVVNWCPGGDFASIDRTLADLGSTSIARGLATRLPERLARAIAGIAGVDPAPPAAQLSREQRRALAHALVEMPLPVAGDRGFAHAEVTAGGVPLREVHLDTMESRVRPGLFLVGEILDVDGRIGGFNFQWAWSSGFVAGCALVHSPLEPSNP